MLPLSYEAVMQAGSAAKLHKKNHSRICRCGFVEQKAAAWFGAVRQNVYLCGVNSGRYGHFDFVA